VRIVVNGDDGCLLGRALFLASMATVSFAEGERIQVREGNHTGWERSWGGEWMVRERLGMGEACSY
jgi:hypothetical protein